MANLRASSRTGPGGVLNRSFGLSFRSLAFTLAVATFLLFSFSFLDTARTDSSDLSNFVMNLMGDVKRKVAVMVDYMIDPAGTITKGAALLRQEGVREVYACSTHAVLVLLQ